MNGKTVPIYISKPADSAEAVMEIVGSIRMDIIRYEDTHGEPPASILVTAALRSELSYYRRAVYNYSVGADYQERLFGIPLSRYYPVGSDTGRIMAYHLTGKERRFVFNQEGV